MEPKFIPIDYEQWDRKEIFERFAPCSYVITADIEITEFLRHVKNNNIRFYPAINYCIAKVCNSDKIFRFAKEDGQIGYYDRVDPLYTLLRKNSDHLFTHKITEYSEDFFDFYDRFLADYAAAEAGDGLYYDNPVPKNALCVSVMPDVSFRSVAFNYNVEGGGPYFPFVTFGKYFERDGKTFVPVASEFHHEINDGYHVGQLFRRLEEVCRRFAETDGFRTAPTL